MVTAATADGGAADGGTRGAPAAAASSLIADIALETNRPTGHGGAGGCAAQCDGWRARLGTPRALH